MVRVSDSTGYRVWGGFVKYARILASEGVGRGCDLAGTKGERVAASGGKRQVRSYHHHHANGTHNALVTWFAGKALPLGLPDCPSTLSVIASASACPQHKCLSLSTLPAMASFIYSAPAEFALILFLALGNPRRTDLY